MKKHLLFVFVSLLPLANAYAQKTHADSLSGDTSHWKTHYKLGINLNQSSFSDNWKGGGVSSIALGSLFNGKAEYEKAQNGFTAETILEYGLVKANGQSLRKSADRIFLNAKYNRLITEKWSAYTAINFQSQFDVGFSYGGPNNDTRTPISRFLAPGELVQTLGVQYQPVKYFEAEAGILALRESFVTDTSLYHGAEELYGVKYNKIVRVQGGFEVIANFQKDIATNLNLKFRFQAFGAYEKLKQVDTRLDIALTAKVNKWVNVALVGTAIDDQDLDAKVQYSQSLLINILLLK